MAGYTSLKTTVCQFVEFNTSYESVHEFISLPTYESIPFVEPKAGSLTVDCRERRNWIVILFSKAICKCYQKFSGHACYSRFATLANAKQTPVSSVRFSFFITENARAMHRHDNDARQELHLNCGFFNASRVKTCATRESVTVSSFPKFRRRCDFSRTFIGS